MSTRGRTEWVGSGPIFVCVGGHFPHHSVACSGYWQGVRMRGWPGSFQAQDKEWRAVSQFHRRSSSYERDTVSSSYSGSLLFFGREQNL